MSTMTLIVKNRQFYVDKQVTIVLTTIWTMMADILSDHDNNADVNTVITGDKRDDSDE